jgi:hypothetical protein
MTAELPEDWMSRPDRRLLRREHEVARAATARRQSELRMLQHVLDIARWGRLRPHWREERLAEAAEELHEQPDSPARIERYLLWLELSEMEVRIWEPGQAAFAAGCEPGWYEGWLALDGWWRELLQCERELEELNSSSVSHWAGFNVVDATPDQWEALLDSHSGPWPERLKDAPAGRPWSPAVHAQFECMRLDRWLFSYEAGLARLGHGRDWMYWIRRHGARVSRWRFAGEPSDALAWIDRIGESLDRPYGGPHECAWPSYWPLPGSWNAGVARATHSILGVEH